MKVKERFSITEFTNPSGAKVFRVQGLKVNGERVRLNFATYAEAIGTKSRLELESHNLLADRVPRVTSLAPGQLADAEVAYRLLGDKDLVKAVRFFLKNYRDPAQSLRLDKAIAQFVAEKRAANCRPLTVRNLELRLAKFAREHPKAEVAEITQETIRDFLFRPGLKPVTQDNNRRSFSAFFSWAKRLGYCHESPLDGIAPIKVDRQEPRILSLPEIRAILSAASGFRDGVMVPYVAIALFAAVRPAELAALTWDAIDLEEKLITISGQIAKMRQRRVVEISDNLVAWLRPHAAAGVPLVSGNWRRDFDTIKAIAGFNFAKHRVNYGAVQAAVPGIDAEDLSKRPEWTVDILRHTGISYHLARFQHEGRTATWAGNSPDMIQRHYKGLVRPRESVIFWGLVPESPASTRSIAA